MTAAQPLVLVIEDDEAIQDAMRMCIEDEGFRVEVSGNGREALDWLAGTSELPCSILLDLMTPIMSGHQFREAQLKDARIAKIPVVVISADGKVDQKSKSMGVTRFLKKPIQLDDLLEILNSLR